MKTVFMMFFGSPFLLVSGSSGAARKLGDPVLPAGGRGSKLPLVFFRGRGLTAPPPEKKHYTVYKKGSQKAVSEGSGAARKLGESGRNHTHPISPESDYRKPRNEEKHVLKIFVSLCFLVFLRCSSKLKVLTCKKKSGK